MSSFVDETEDKRKRSPQGQRRDSRNSQVLEPLGTALLREDFQSLKLFDGLCVASLEAVIELLKAYATEIAGMNAMYRLLRGLQVGFRAPTEDDEQAVLKEFVPMANQFARRLLHLDARLAVLVSDLEDEFWNEYGAVQGRDGWRIYDVLFRQHHKKIA
jgi:hypothetical protein